MIQQTLGIVIMPAKQEGIALFLNKANRLWGGANDLSPFGLSAASFTRLIAKEGNE
jgi:hypothetical protein